MYVRLRIFRKLSVDTKLKINFNEITNIALIIMTSSNQKAALLYCSLLALQFGLQPILASRYTASGVSKSSIVIATEIGKIIIAFISIITGPKEDRQRIARSWNWVDSLKVAALPATLYAVQNVFVQYGYVLLDSMSFNLLNQTKVSPHNK